MNSKMKKVLATIIIAVVIVGWCLSIFGAGPIKPIKDKMKYGLDINGGVYVVMEADTDLKGEQLKKTMDQTRAVLNNRVNAMGLSEATVSLEGDKRLRVEMPGVEDSEEAIDQIGKTAQLRFLLADGTQVMTGQDVKDAGIDTDNENGGYKITLQFTKKGAKKFTEATTKAYSGQVKSMNKNIANNAIVIMLDDEVVTAPSCSNGPINSPGCDITSANGYPKEEASNTAALIRGGALPLNLHEVTSSVQTATVGADALDKSIVAGAIGLALVFVLMIVAYNMLGVMADIALALYVLLVLWIMAGMGSVLTLPGIAGIILSIGMAVDANVIIFTRIKEEIGKGKSIRVAVDQGFRHALVTVLDAQITTLIAAVVLYQIGSTSVKGFAITLMIGIVISIFTAVAISQILIGTLAESPKFAKNKFFGIGKDGQPKKFIKKKFKFIEKRKIFYTISAGVIILGLVFSMTRGFNYGIDFTGGTMMQIDMGKKVSAAQIEKDLSEYKLDPTIIATGEGQKEVIIKTIKALDADQRGQVVKTLGDKYGITKDNVLSSDQFGPTVGRELKTNALKSVAIAALGMLIYIIFRFKSWKYGVASIAGVVHDVLIMLSLYAIFNITINNPFIAAILTVVGYSINDTIVIFDRIRENRVLFKRDPLIDTINSSVNQTLSRSIMTSLTTLICMIPMVVLVSTSIREFVVPLMVGVLVGTYSSIFLCSPLLYDFSKEDTRSEYVKRQEEQKKKKNKNK